MNEDNGGPVYDPSAPVPVRPMTVVEEERIPQVVGRRGIGITGGLAAVALIAGSGIGWVSAPHGRTVTLPGPTVTATASVTATEIHTFPPSPMTATATSIVTVTAPAVTRTVAGPVRVQVVRRVATVTQVVTRLGPVVVVRVTATRTVTRTVKR